VKAYWNFDPTAKPAPGGEEKWVAESLPILDANYETVGYFPDGVQRWGQFPQNSLGEYINAMFANGIIANKDVDQANVYTNDFVDAFNKFDRAAVEDKARAAK
jgi:NitT/TauT family transport system substrate-binding protein